MIRIQTTLGTFTLELDADAAPATVANFERYVRDGFYAGTSFHRVIPNFMVQGGGLLPDMSQKPTHAPVANEAKNGLKNARGSIAMARTSDPHSATAQFFINVKDNGFLDHPGQDGWGYCVFGKVVDGMDVIDAIVAVPTANRRGHQNVPVEPVLIEKAEIVE